MQVNEIDFTTAATLLLRIEVNAGLTEYSLSRVNSYTVSLKGQQQKNEIIQLLRENRYKIIDWASGAKLSEQERTLLRSLYNQHTVMITTCKVHLEVITATLAGQLECV